MESRETLPLPTSPQKMIDTLGTKPHCQMCALYALTRAKLSRIPCRNCATKAFVDSPVLLLYLFREFVTMSNRLRSLVNRDKDLTRTVVEDFDLRLTTIHAHLRNHTEDTAIHFVDDDRDRGQDLVTRIDQVRNKGQEHHDATHLHFLEPDRQALSDTIDRVEAIQKELDRLKNT